MSGLQPVAKRKCTDISTIGTDPPEYVAYSDYIKLHKQVTVLTELVNQLRHGIIENGSSKLVEKIVVTCLEAPAIPSPGPPIPAEIFMDSVSTPAPISKSFSNAILASVSSSQCNNRSPQLIDPSEIAKQAAVLLEKSTRAVIERAPDDKTPQQDLKDHEFITNISKKHSLPIPSQVFRHHCSSRFRPLKLQFSTKAERDSFIKGFNSIRHKDAEISAIDPKLRCRRDLTLPELETLRTSRKFVYDENVKAKQTKYIMVDISYKINSQPRAFT